MLEDSELLRRYVRDRDQVAFEELVRRHLNQVHASALRRVGNDAHLAADVTQGVFTALAQQARWLVNHPTLVGWLHTTTRNQAANIVRSEKRRKAREAETHFMNQPDTSIDALDWKIAGPALESALDELSERDRAALLLRFAEGKSFPAIGQLTGATEDAARMRVDRALQKLRTHLARRGIVSTAALLGGAITAQAAVEAPNHLMANICQTAIGTASASLPSAVTIVDFMITTKFAANLTAATLVVLAAGTAAYETHAAAQTKSELQALRSETNRLERSINELNEKSKAANLAAVKVPATEPDDSAKSEAAGALATTRPTQSSAAADPAAPAEACARPIRIDQGRHAAPCAQARAYAGDSSATHPRDHNDTGSSKSA